MRERYQKRISGPIMDRIDLHVSVPAVDVQKLTDLGTIKTETSAIVRMRVQKARNIQTKRYKDTQYAANSDLSTKAVKEFCPLTSEVIAFLRQAVVKLGLSARSYYRVIKVSRTIADLGGDKEIEIPHVAEALQYRPKEN
jgi:magnesium chelatase family protein